ncbi:hypothetical protein D3C81_663680 [compost metagenome]
MQSARWGRMAPAPVRHGRHAVQPVPGDGPVPACWADGCRRHRLCRLPAQARSTGLPRPRAVAPRAPAPSHFPSGPKAACRNPQAALPAAASVDQNACASHRARHATAWHTLRHRRYLIRLGTTACRADLDCPAARSSRCKASQAPLPPATVQAVVRRLPSQRGSATAHRG